MEKWQAPWNWKRGHRTNVEILLVRPITHLSQIARLSSIGGVGIPHTSCYNKRVTSWSVAATSNSQHSWNITGSFLNLSIDWKQFALHPKTYAKKNRMFGEYQILKAESDFWYPEDSENISCFTSQGTASRWWRCIPGCRPPPGHPQTTGRWASNIRWSRWGSLPASERSSHRRAEISWWLRSERDLLAEHSFCVKNVASSVGKTNVSCLRAFKPYKDEMLKRYQRHNCSAPLLSELNDFASADDVPKIWRNCIAREPKLAVEGGTYQWKDKIKRFWLASRVKKPKLARQIMT